MRKLLLGLLWLLAWLFIHTTSLNAYTSCMDYWMAIESSPWYCKCMSWYVWWTNAIGEQYCVSWNSACTKEYWYMAEYDSLTGKCWCSRWYGFMTDSFWNTSCERMSKICQKKLWYWSEYDSLEKQCECSYWYTLEKTISWYQCVMANCWLYWTFNDYTKSCDCNKGYTFKNWTCEKTAVSQYFTLQELNKAEDEAIVYSTYAGYNKYYKIWFWYGCNNVSNYLWSFVVLNLMYDGVLNYGDFLVLQDDDQVCTVNSVILATSSDTYKSCSDIFWSNSIELSWWKCTCKSGYKWSNDRKSCIIKCKPGKIRRWDRCI